VNKTIIPVFLFGLSFDPFSYAHAKEVFLECKVDKEVLNLPSFAPSGSEKDIFTLSFDEDKNTSSIPGSLSSACGGGLDFMNPKFCRCNLDDKMFECESESTSKEKPATEKVYFWIHRFTGRFSGYKSISNSITKDGIHVNYEGKCEKFTSKKF
jgi:hypothetical protein